MESFFGQMKCRILDLVALCPTSEVAVRLIEGYLDDYNNKIYQYSLAGLTPAEYYTYVTTGIYPCDSYYGVKADELLPIGELVNARLDAAREKAAKVREQNRAKREAAEQLVSTPTLIISRDKARLNREKGKWQKSRDAADKQINHIDSIIEKTREALKFIVTSSKEVLDELKYPQNWQKYKELDYIFEMRQLF